MGYWAMFSGYVLAGVFGTAIIGKVRDLPAFASAVRAFGVSPRRSGQVAVVVLAAEGLCVVLCLVPGLVTAGLVLGAALLTGFALAGRSVARRQGAVPCRCFGGASDDVTDGWHAGRNLVLAGLAVSGVVVQSVGEPVLAGRVVVIAAALLTVVLVITFVDLVRAVHPSEGT